jgi:aspartate/methionine/tyrosine aminotransferase
VILLEPFYATYEGVAQAGGATVVTKYLDSSGQFIDGDLLSMPAVKDASSPIVLKVVKKNRAIIN